MVRWLLLGFGAFEAWVGTQVLSCLGNNSCGTCYLVTSQSGQIAVKGVPILRAFCAPEMGGAFVQTLCGLHHRRLKYDQPDHISLESQFAYTCLHLSALASIPVHSVPFHVMPRHAMPRHSMPCHPSIGRFIHPRICLSIKLSICLIVCLLFVSPLCVSVSLSLGLSGALSLPRCLSLNPSAISLSPYHCISQYLYLMHLHIGSNVTYISIYLSVCLSAIYL